VLFHNESSALILFHPLRKIRLVLILSNYSGKLSPLGYCCGAFPAGGGLSSRPPA
jgi:hypothetical protein